MDAKLEPMSEKPVWAVGLMSGTSLDGIDAALLSTDGGHVVEPGPGLTVAYDPGFRDRVRACFGQQEAPPDVIRNLTDYHAQAVAALLDQADIPREHMAVVGFHGQTIHHDPGAGLTVQIGDGASLARQLGIPVVDQMRLADVATGGQGAPLAPAFHAAMASPYRGQPCGFLNMGGVANITYVPPGTGPDYPDPVAFDTGPGNALIDDWVRRHTGHPFDQDGKLAASGTVDRTVLDSLLAHPYFAQPYPKSADRDDFASDVINDLSPADGAATLVALTVESIGRGIDALPRQPAVWWASGGGRHNPQVMAGLHKRLAPAQVKPVEDIGWAGDMVEAWAFAYLAVRSLKGLPLSFPTTTGVRQAITGGRLYQPPGADP
ncbi:MAG: anhydro-N-acetylmuramic acid kinase [Pseudomonadota bacterium]